jgi:signal transduction histidine kinase
VATPRGSTSVSLAHGAALVVLVLGASAIAGALALGWSAVGDEGADALARSLAIVALPALVLAALSAWLGARAVARDVEEIATRVRTMAERGVWDQPVPMPSLDEIGELARAVEALRRRLADLVARGRGAREDAEVADRYKDEFLHAVSHELRTPLNAILGFSGVLLDEIDGPLSESHREDVAMIHASGKHLLALFEDVIDFSAMASGRMELELEPVDLGEAIAEVAALVGAQRKDRPIEIRTEIAPDLPPVLADPVRVRQIVMNLATNALKFTERGKVTLAARPHGSGVEIEVRDTGVGIPADELAAIFEPYKQLGTARKRGSAGLGLAIVHELTTLLGGTIRVESEVAKGSAFFVVLPRASAS